MCVDPIDKNGNSLKRILFGREGSVYRESDISFIPCIPKQLTEENKHLVDKECIADYNDPKSLEAKFQESKAYLGRPAINLLTNSGRMDLTKFGEESIVKYSSMIAR